ncbi:MAG: response regulator transcription factor, partial [Solirubrobacterales bacterium]|nr:response regulator transcription factor [Solirubrobacterales bacterium]
ESNVPIIMLTAKDSEIDKVVGLEIGADDYVTKPFAFEELLARVRARLRDSGRAEAQELVHGDGVHLDLRTRRATVAGREIELSAREFALAEIFLRHAGQVLSREQLLNGVWGYDHDPGTNIVGVYIAYLRRKLAIDGEIDPIETLRSVGYRLRDDR